MHQLQKTNLPLSQTLPDQQFAFDFLIGEWAVQHRRLKRRLQNDTEWVHFGGTCIARPILGRLGNIDDNVLDFPEGSYRAATIRIFDPKRSQWSIWWIDSRTPTVIDTPVCGDFRDGVGNFLCNETFDGKPILVKFTWSSITEISARWEQAFSPDNGASWETNWIMDFTRSDFGFGAAVI